MLRKLLKLTSRTKSTLGNSLKRKSSPSTLPVGMLRRETAHQVVIKQGYLLKLPETSSRFGGSLKRPVRKWFVFGSLNGCLLFLDSYSSEETVFAGVPEETIDLKDCLCILSNQKHPSTSEYVFTIVLKDRKVSLATISRTLMQDWCATIERNLKKNGIIDSVGGENEYFTVSYFPRKPHAEQFEQSPLSENVSAPSPEVHEQHSGELTNQEHDGPESNEYETNYNLYSNFSESETGPYLRMLRPDSQSESPDDYLEQDANPDDGSFQKSHIVEQRQTNSPHKTNDTYVNLSMKLNPIEDESVHKISTLNNKSSNDRLSSLGHDIYYNLPNNSTNLPESYKEEDADDYMTANIIILPPCPDVLASDLSSSFSALLTSKTRLDKVVLNHNRTLVEECYCIVSEIESDETIDFLIPDLLEVKKIFNLIEFGGAVWIGKCSSKELKKSIVHANLIHPGDQLMSLDNQPIKQIKSSPQIICQFSIKRTPLAKIVLIKHSFKGKYTCTDDYFKELGLLMMPGKLQVFGFIPDGLVARSGLSSEGSRCDWHITQINLEDVIFSPWHKIEEIIKVTSLDPMISLTFQPSDLVRQITKDD